MSSISYSGELMLALKTPVKKRTERVSIINLLQLQIIFKTDFFSETTH